MAKSFASNFLKYFRITSIEWDLLFEDCLRTRNQNLPSNLPGSEIYQETLAKALAKHFGATLLVVDSLLLPGVSFPQVFLYICLSLVY